MYDLQYVRKRRRRKIAAVVAFFATIGVTSLIITSFLGHTTGTFTVAVVNSSVSLALSKTEDFAEQTSYLRIDTLPKLSETTYDSLPAADILDNEEVTYKDLIIPGETEKDDYLELLKYTFYVKNVGNTVARYNLNVNISDRTKAIDGTGRVLDDTLRVMVFENDPSQEGRNEPTIYAKEAAEYNYDIEGNRTRREFISTYPSGSNQEDDEHKLAETFLPGQTVAKYSVGNFKRNDLKRYTIVIWLEGEDPQSTNDKQFPEGATVKLGVDIAAYENA